MLLTKDNGIKRMIFDSIEDQIEVMQKEAIPAIHQYCEEKFLHNGSMKHHADWIGREFKNWDEVFTALRSYWTEGMTIYEQMMYQLHDCHLVPPRSLKRQATWSEDDGSEVDIERLQRGDAYWRTTQRHHRPGPIAITLMTQLGAPAAYSSQKLMWRGAASICLTELLEQAGYRVELWGCRRSADSYVDRSTAFSATCLKRMCDPLDVSTLINTTSGWGTRMLIYGSSWAAGHNAYGHGYTTSITNESKHVSQDENIIFCEDVWSFDAAVRWIKQEIEKLK